MTDPLTEYLSEPCDEPGCDQTATHNGYSKADTTCGQWCNQHCDWNQPAHARND